MKTAQTKLEKLQEIRRDRYEKDMACIGISLFGFAVFVMTLLAPECGTLFLGGFILVSILTHEMTYRNSIEELMFEEN